MNFRLCTLYRIEQANINCFPTDSQELLSARSPPMPRFSSIPVEHLRPLLNEIERDFREWSKTVSQKKLDWNGLSGPIQTYFKEAVVDPSKKYAQYYSPERHTIALSYVWSQTGLMKIAGEFLGFISFSIAFKKPEFLLFEFR